MHSILAYSLDHEQVVNAILYGYRIIGNRSRTQIVVSRAAAVVNVRVGMTLAFPEVMRLDAANGVLFEFVHVQNEKRHACPPSRF